MQAEAEARTALEAQFQEQEARLRRVCAENITLQKRLVAQQGGSDGYALSITLLEKQLKESAQVRPSSQVLPDQEQH